MRHQISQILLGSVQGTRLSKLESEFFKENHAGGVTLFKRNFDPLAPDLISSLINDIMLFSKDLKAIVAIDQEGGRVSRTNQATNLGAPLHICDGKISTEAKSIIFDYGYSVGRDLKRLGVNLNFAPVLDIYDAQGHSAIGDRAWGKSPKEVIARAKPFLQGMREAGVQGCLKHFPGQGSAQGDTHLKSVSVPKSRRQLMAWEVEPFRELVAESMFVMIGHCFYPSLDHRYQATMSTHIINDLLKKQLGFKGVVVSDDMTMGAVKGASLRKWHKNLFDTIMVGVDLVLICQELDLWNSALDYLSLAANENGLFRKRIDDAYNRIMEARKQI